MSKVTKEGLKEVIKALSQFKGKVVFIVQYITTAFANEKVLLAISPTDFFVFSDFDEAYSALQKTVQSILSDTKGWENAALAENLCEHSVVEAVFDPTVLPSLLSTIRGGATAPLCSHSFCDKGGSIISIVTLQASPIISPVISYGTNNNFLN